MRHQGESQNEAIKRDRTLVPEIKDRLRGQDLEEWNEQVEFGPEAQQS